MDTAAAENLTVVLVCADLGRLGCGLDAAELRRRLEVRRPKPAFAVIPRLCEGLKRLGDLWPSGKASRLVLGLCSADYPRIQLHAEARKLGIDPFGLEIVDLGGDCLLAHANPLATSKAALLLAAACARAEAFEGSRPENAKAYLATSSERMSRASLFTLPPIGYRPVPSIQRERCIAQAGCDLCVSTCPASALTFKDGGLMVDRPRCVSCALCVTACPRGAVELPGFSAEQTYAQLATLLGTAAEPDAPRGILFRCRASAATNGSRVADSESGALWLPVEVPCAGQIPPAWILNALALGAGAVAVVSCEEACQFGQIEKVKGRVSYCQELLGLSGPSEPRVHLLRPADVTATPVPSSVAGVGGGENTASPRRLASESPGPAVLRLLPALGDDGAEAAGQGSRAMNARVVHPSSPLGLVEIDKESCTACWACAYICPSGALGSEDRGSSVVLTFHPSFCIACGLCTSVCPEASRGAIRMTAATDLGLLRSGRREVQRDAAARCLKCGNPVAPNSMLRRVIALLSADGEADADTIAAISRTCPTCRSQDLTAGPI